jgi:hypothetical protein
MNATVPLIVLTLLAASTTLGQGGNPPSEESDSFDLTIANTGLSFGNGQDMNGVRIAWRDGDFIRVNGLNLSLWLPYDNPSGEVSGISLGVLGPGARRLRGLSIGLGGVVADESMDGINLGGLGLVSQGTMRGVNLAGLGLVAQGSAAGLNVGGLGVVSQGSLIGVNLAGLGLVGQRDLIGLNIGGLGTVTQGDVFGFNVGGLGVVTQGDVAGFTVAGLGVVSQAEVQGVTISGLGVVSQSGITGLNVAGVGFVTQQPLTGFSATIGMARSEQAIRGMTFAAYRLKAPEITGVNLAIAWTESDELTGLTIAGYNRTYGLQQGLVIGIFNHAEELLGVQIGLLNHVENNPSWARFLPLFNANF